MLTIRNKFIVVGTLIFVSVVGILLSKNYLMNKVQSFSGVEKYLSTVRGDMLMLRRNEKDFLARLDLKYEKKFADNFEILLTSTDQLERSVIQTGLGSDNIEQMREAFLSYEQSFAQLIATQKLIGVNPKDGYYGALRQAVHDAEKNINSVDDQQLRADMLQLRRNEKDFMLRLDEKYVDRFTKNISVFDNNLTQSNHSDTQKSAIQQAMSNYQAHFTKLVEGMRQKGLDSQSGIIGEMRRAVHDSETAIADIDSSLQEQIKDEVGSTDRMIMLVSIVSLVFVVAIIGLLYWLGRGILESINSLGNVIRYSSEHKDLSLRFDASRKDELGETGQAFNEMMDSFQSTVLDVNNASIQMSAAAEELSVVTAQTDENIHRQKSETTTLANTIRQMVEATALVAQHSSQAAESSSATTAEASQGREVINSAVNTISSLEKSISSASSAIERVDQDSEKIGSVLDVIRGIAEQTNLLALNAAIEAARAGEQGRGFAVVADEVRTLAGRTQESTQEIQAMIESLQIGTKEAVSMMAASSDLTADSVEKTSSADQQFLQIAKSIDHISHLNSEISSSAQVQEQNSNDVNSNIDVITEITEQTELGAKETSSASRDLAKIATQLHVMVNQFKVSSDS